MQSFVLEGLILFGHYRGSQYFISYVTSIRSIIIFNSTIVRSNRVTVLPMNPHHVYVLADVFRYWLTSAAATIVYIYGLRHVNQYNEACRVCVQHLSEM